jgi:hypothetical protein
VISLKVDVKGLGGLVKQLRLISSPALRKRILKKVASRLIRSAKQRTVTQTDLEGARFAPHARKRKRKMLTRLANRLKVKVLTDSLAEVGWRNSVEGGIAAKQQFGYSQAVNKRNIKDRKPVNSTEPATRRQAVALISAGYKVKRNAGRIGYQRPSMRWITENLNVGQASVILRMLRGVKDSWKTELPPRSFLGVNELDMKALANAAIEELDAILKA